VICALDLLPFDVDDQLRAGEYIHFNLGSELTMNSSDMHLASLPATGPDRRHSHRYTINVPIEIREESSQVPMRLETTDISRGGCYIQMMIPLSVGIRPQVKLWLNGIAVIARGLVVTRHPQFGNGIMFVEFEGEGEKVLKEYLQRISF
jgi:PilZ domain